MLRNIVAVIVGLIVGMAWNMTWITLNSSVFFPMPEGQSPNDPEQYAAYAETLPALAFVVVLVAHLGQAGVGGWVAARVGKASPLVLAGIVGALTLAGSVAALLMIPGPVWMWSELLLIPVVTWLAARCEIQRRATAS